MTTDKAIRDAVGEALNIEPSQLLPETELGSIPDFDSVQLLTLMVTLDEIGVILPPAQAASLRTFGDILALNRS